MIAELKSKELESKVVGIPKVVKDMYGFTCEIEDYIHVPAREDYQKQDLTIYRRNKQKAMS